MNRRASPLALPVNHGRICKGERRVDLIHSLLKPSTAQRDPENDHLWGERLKKGEALYSSAIFTFGVLIKGLNAKHGPDIGKPPGEWFPLGSDDDDDDTKDGEGRCRLDENSGNTCIHSGCLWAKNLPC